MTCDRLVVQLRPCSADGYGVIVRPHNALSSVVPSPYGEVTVAAIAQMLPDAVVVVDPGARVRWANEAAEQMFGISLADAAGVTGLDLVHPDDLAIAMLALGSVREKGVGTLLELRVRSADGWRLAEIRGAAFGDDTLLVIRDLTTRRRWEVAGDDTARFRSVMQYAASITMLLSDDGTVSTSSASLTRTLGHDQEQVEGKPLADLVEPDDRRKLVEALAEQERARENRERSKPVTIEIHLRTSTGTAVPFSLAIVDLVDDPTVNGLVVSGHDVSDRVHAEQQVREATSLLAATLDSTADGILVVDREGVIRMFNARFAEMWGLSDQVLATRDDDDALAAVLDQLPDPDVFLAKIRELYAQPEKSSHDHIEFNDGRVFERVSLPQYIDGDVVGRVWNFRDITDHVMMQRELTRQTLHDPLTGLANRSLLRDRIEHAATWRGPDRPICAVLFVDLDDFKAVNDDLGHAVGDQLLATTANRLAECARPQDTVARIGGDEFAVFVVNLDTPRDALTIAERIHAALREPVRIGATSIPTTASIGVAYTSPGQGCDELLHNADVAMYHAKRAGKNCVRVSSSTRSEQND